MTNIENRRGFLRALGGAAAFAGFGQAFGDAQAAPTVAASKTPTDLLNLATTAEALSVTFYHHALSGAEFAMDDSTRAQLLSVLAAEQHHLNLLRAQGGRPLTGRFSLPDDVCTDARSFAETGLELEAVFTGAYVAAAHQFAELHHPELAATAAQLGASEAQHLSLLSQLAGFGPGELTLPAIPFKQLSDAPALLAPYLRSGAGRVQVTLPTPRQVQAMTGKQGATPVAFVDAYQRRGRHA